ncbi:BBP7 family outer membrane beta-barrel protein [Rhodopirellula bahusiensis]|uniref:BBP7 family outer membrane beta-barrel protein n=1 Tax=Rhodopirellula bahusiensis TaxID=2014065 RepID=UPI0032671375
MMAQTPDPQIKPGPNQRTGLRVTLEDNGMTESFSESVTVKLRKLRDLVCGGLIAAAVATPVAAAPPTAGDEMDYAASGFMLPPGVQPAGMVDGMPAMSMPPGSMPGAQSIATTLPSAPLRMPGGFGSAGYAPAGYPQPGYAPNGVMPVGYQGGGFLGGGYAAGCDMMNCGCGDSGCTSGECGSNFQGLLPAVMGDCCGSCGGGGCGACGGMGSCLTNGSLGQGGLLGSLNECGPGSTDFGILAAHIGGGLAALSEAMRPYSEAGKSAQRWYDVSVEGLFLTQELDGFADGRVLTNDGTTGTPNVADNPVLTQDDLGDDDLEAGARISFALIFGAGSNVEFTYMGGQEWEGSASATSATSSLTSIYSGYGTTPGGGYANLADFQQISSRSEFDSYEINYRRRTVGPYGRFQGSWLLGLRHVVFDNAFAFNGSGTPASTIADFQQSFDIDNRFFGPQAGVDLWWNAHPGIQLGAEVKGAWVQNDFDQTARIGTTPGGLETRESNGQDGTFILDFQATGIYRFSHSLSLRGSYHLLTIEDVMAAPLDNSFIDDFQNNGAGVSAPTASETSLTLNGFAAGLEYMW